jgi:hypothetical protein
MLWQRICPALLLISALGGCGSGHKQADALDRAADQSDPTAAAQLHNEADAIRDTGAEGNVSDAGSPAQAALQNAGNAAAATPPAAQTPARPTNTQTGAPH